MGRLDAVLAVATLALMAAGCAPAPEDPVLRDFLRRPPSVLAPLPAPAEPRPPQGAPTPQQAEQVPLPEKAGPEDYVRMALERNPGLRAAEEKVHRLAERIPQATTLDDPMLHVAPVGKMAQTAAGEVSTMAGVSQKLPFPGKLAARGRLASQEAAASAEEFIEARLALIADVRKAYWSYYFATSAIDLTRRSRGLLDQFRQVAESKLRAGTTSQQDVLRVITELGDLDNQILTWGQRRTAAIAMLNSLLNRPASAPVPPPRPAQVEKLSMDMDRLLAAAAQNNPQLAKVQKLIEAERQRLRLAKLQRWPDLTVSLEYNVVDKEGLVMKPTGDDQWWVGFAINVPLWGSKLSAGEREARRGIRERTSQLTDTLNRITFRIQDAFAKVDALQRQLLNFRDLILPQAQQAVDVSLADYRTGRLEFLTVIDNWRKLLSFQLLYEQSAAQLEQDFADLEQAVGRDIERQPAVPTVRRTADPPPAKAPQ